MRSANRIVMWQSPSTLAAAVALSVTALGAAADCSAQSGDPDPAADSARVHAEARKAQAAFERVRRFRLPWTFRGVSGHCDEIVGRYCVRHDRGDDRWTPPREHRAISEARDLLLARLRAALRSVPGDAWIIGQRIAYLLDAGRLDDALDEARGCGAAAWWCDALTGLVHHVRDEPVPAERAFARAQRRLPPDESIRWNDLRPVLTRQDARRLERADPAARDSLAAVYWWLADPLWMRAGNDRFTEQRARLVRARIAAEARNPEGTHWGWDLEELLLRLGWPSGWERYSSGGLERRVGFVTHRAPFGRDFGASLEQAAAPFGMVESAWDLTPHIPVTEYAPHYARFEGAVQHQLVVIPDGDSATIAAVAAFQHDSVATDANAEIALVAAAPGFMVMDSSHATARRAVRSLRVPRRDLVGSIEALVTTDVVRAGRARFGLPLARRDSSAIALSDPLLMDAGPPPRSRAEAIDRLLLPSDAASADSIGVYFEAERLAPDVPIEIELMLEPERGGVLRRIGATVGLVTPRTAVRLAWIEAPPAGGRLTRGVTLGFLGVPAGRYALHLIVRQGSAWGASRASLER